MINHNRQNPGRNPGLFRTKLVQFVMKKIIVRKDLMSKSDYSKKYGINRPAIDRMIKEGKLIVEEISGKHYIKLDVK